MSLLTYSARLAFAAIVFLSANALGEPIGPDPSTNKPHDVQETPPPPESKSPLAPLDVGQPPAESNPDSFFYPYQSSISVNFGPYFYYNPNQLPLMTYGLFNITYLWNSSTSTHAESGFEMVTNAEGHFWTSARWNYYDTKRTRPFVSAGMGVKTFPQGPIASFLLASNYFLRAAGGVEQSTGSSDSPATARGEFFLSYPFAGVLFFGVTFGYVFGL